MKKVWLSCVSFLLFTQLVNTGAQEKREKIAVLGIDVHGVVNKGSAESYTYEKITPAQMSNLVRLEIEKYDSFEVTDRYDANYILGEKKMNSDSCFGKIGALDYGKILDVDKAITGSVERYADFVVFNLRLIDVKKRLVVKTEVKEFLNLPNEIQLMVRITLNEMFGYPNDQEVVTRLTKQYNYENIINNPQKNRLNLSGPRMGLVGYAGDIARILDADKSVGGYEAWPVMFQFGYQFEVQYLNEGKYQALFEFIPMITGMDQNLLIPSVTVFNGLRNNINGWEFALGPTFNVVQMADGYYDASSDSWVRNGEYHLDSRGDYTLRTSFVIAVGKSFKSGKLNIPFNAFFIPAREGCRFGLSFGFNAKK